MPSGLLLIDKPTGITSFDVIRTARKKLNIRKMGHAGTLDPFASGLMIVAVEEGTKALSELLLSDKEYIAEVHFGATSTTDDSEGEKTPTQNFTEFSQKDLEKILDSFMGTIEQIPPPYSALKVQGKRACDRVRAGEDMTEVMQEKKRTIKIRALEILSFQFPTATLRVHCSTGTYIRSLARDIGQVMKCGAYLENLRRTKIGNFQIQDAQGLEEISENDVIRLKPEFFSLPSVQVSEVEEAELRMGRIIQITNDELFTSADKQMTNKQKVSLFCGERMVGFGEIQNGKIQPRRLLRV